MPINSFFGQIGNPYKGLYGGITQSPEGMRYFINNLINAVMIIAGLLLFFYLIFGGFQYLTAGGNEDAIESATKTIRNAVIGLLIVVGAWFITKIVETLTGVPILSPEFTGP
ncbi:MAG: pilin [Patescibacteria group bacterium]|nr:pilin [Patescibacteria group bacterium]